METPPAVPVPAEDGSLAANPLPGRFLFNNNFVFVASLISNTIGFIVAILLARALGPDGRGVAALYQAAVSLGFAFLNMGISLAAFYFVARRELTPRQGMEAGLTISLFAALITALGVAIATLLFEGELAKRPMPYWLIILAIPVIIQLRLAEALLRAQGRFGAMNLLDVGLPITMLIALGGTELIAGLTVSRAIWAWTLALLPPLLLGYVLLGRSAWPRRLGGLALVLKATKFGGQGQFTNLIQLLNYRLDGFLILIFVNTAGVGLYTVAVSQTEGLWIIANSVAIVLLTNITSGDEENAMRMTPVVCRNTLLVTAVGALGGLVLAPLLIEVIFGTAYRGAVTPYLLLLPGTVALSGAKILSAYVFSRGRPMINAWIALITLVITIPTDLVLIWLFGVAGAAAGTSFGYCLSLALTAIAYRRLSGGSIWQALVPQLSDAALYLDGVKSLWRRLRRTRAAGATPWGP